MNTLLRLEQVGFVALALYVYHQTGFPWWLLPATILLPDISAAGYLVNPKVGSWTYNLAHHQALGCGFIIAGMMLPHNTVLFIGLILLIHSATDRLLGYGLKYPDRFTNTHLGEIGSRRNK